jgi:D-alanyl-D-alanine carboxypeptidase
MTSLLALLASALFGLPSPAALHDPTRLLAGAIPEGRVLVAETERREDSPARVRDTLGPNVTAESYVVVDVASGSVLTAKAPSAIRPVASLTKLLTAVTVLQYADPDDRVTVSAQAARGGRSGADMELIAGEAFRLQDLLAGLLIPSANDAAIALSEHVAGSERAFADNMNRVAQSLGMLRTHVVNATGFDNEEHFSSAYDMALLLSHAWRDPLLGVYLRARTMDVTPVNGGRTRQLRTTNRLLGKRADILAGKTGFTDAAGQSLAVVAENDEGRPVVAVVLGSRDRFADMNTILDWTFWAHAWPSPSPAPSLSPS